MVRTNTKIYRKSKDEEREKKKEQSKVKLTPSEGQRRPGTLVENCSWILTEGSSVLYLTAVDSVVRSDEINCIHSIDLVEILRSLLAN